MLERDFQDLRVIGGEPWLWSFVILHPKDTFPRLVIQAPEKARGIALGSPVFDAGAVRDWLNELPS